MKASRTRRNERGQAMLEYSLIMWVLMGGAMLGGWPFFVMLMNAIDTYFQSIYWMLSQPM